MDESEFGVVLVKDTLVHVLGNTTVGEVAVSWFGVELRQITELS